MVSTVLFIDMKQSTVLIVEDSPYLAESLQDLLEMNGFEAIVAPNGKQGVTLALLHKPDLILLDIRLPDITGYEVFNQIRSDEEWGRNASISILTASESIDTISKNINLPIENVLFKPEWSLSALLEHIKQRVVG